MSEPAPDTPPAAASRPPAPGLRTSLPWEFTRAVLLEYFGVMHCIRYTGQRNVPTTGPMILAPNHVSYYDPMLVAAGVPNRVRFMAWDALFRIPGLAQFITSYGAFPVKTKSADKGAIEASLRILRAEECLMLFPEGARSSDGQLMELEKGLPRLAVQTDATIVPVTITGGFEAWPRQHLFPRPGPKIIVKYHTPIKVRRADYPDAKSAVDVINSRLQAIIARRLAAYDRAMAMRRKRR